MKIAMYIESRKSGHASNTVIETRKWAVIEKEEILFTSQSIADCESYLRLRQEELLGEPIEAPGYVSPFRCQEGELVP